MDEVSILTRETKQTLYCGDSLEITKLLPDNSVDSIISDPPYGLSQHSKDDIVNALLAWLREEEYTHSKKGFMAKTWDSFVPSPAIWRECYRVLKPGGHMLVFAGTRTQDIMGISLRLAGFEIRDTIMWVYGSGFPKSHDVSKAIDKLQGNSRNVNKKSKNHISEKTNEESTNTQTYGIYGNNKDITSPGSEDSEHWEGWGTALKPSYEPIILVRKPLEQQTVAKNVLEYGTGAINIDATRIPTQDDLSGGSFGEMFGANRDEDGNLPKAIGSGDKGRWPSNLILEREDETVEACFPDTSPGKRTNRGQGWSSDGSNEGWKRKSHTQDNIGGYNDNGDSASRYFNGFSYSEDDLDFIRLLYYSKANKKDRNEGLEDREKKQYSYDGRNTTIENPYQRNNSMAQNFHPTVKPTALMQHLCRLITPKDGTVYDPFMGSGSTGKAAKLEGFDFVGCEIDREYTNLAAYRLGLTESDILTGD